MSDHLAIENFYHYSARKLAVSKTASLLGLVDLLDAVIGSPELPL